MLKLLKRAHQLRGKFESAVFDKDAADPAKTQKLFLLNLLKKNANSFFGKLHNFSRIQNEMDFRRSVPIRDYEEFRSFINQIIAGEQYVLTAENPLMLTMTSGTTGEPKFIPVTRESQASSASLMLQWLYRAECDHKNLTAHQSVGIVSRAIEGLTAGGLPYGSASGLIYQNIPWFIRRAYAVPYAVAEIADYDARYFALARFALAAPRVSFVATPNPSTLLRLAQICLENQEKLIRCIHDGTLGLENSQPSEICSQLSRGLKPNPARAKFLAHVAEKNGFLRFADCWPDLKLVGCWLGGSVGGQANKLEKNFGKVARRDLGFMASEGRFTIPVADGGASGILALNSSYYEFVPEAESDSEQPHVASAAELESGQRYSILLTNAAGLYRYKIGDIVEVTGFYRKTPLIAFVQKAGEMANITGEKMHANHFVRAFEIVASQYNLKFEQFCVVPNFELSRYEIYLELSEEFSFDKLCARILPEIDSVLQSLNIEYQQKRRSKRLAAPCIHLMKRGWSENVRRRYIAAGGRDTQYKWRNLCSALQAEDEPFVVAVRIKNQIVSVEAEKV